MFGSFLPDKKFEEFFFKDSVCFIFQQNGEFFFFFNIDEFSPHYSMGFIFLTQFKCCFFLY